jgi:N-terminal acetyltransferase B complex non-catalytic subunit
MSLIRLNEGKIGAKEDAAPNPILIQAAGLLEHLIGRSPHNYEALLLLVRIYLLLGAGSLALKTFSKLSVKQMQYETVAHSLLTRISTIHPHAAPCTEETEKDFNPQAALKLALSFYQSSEMATTAARTSGLEHGSYLNVEGSIDLHNSLKYSICRKMWVLETRRIQRLVGGASVNLYDQLGKCP